LALPFPYLPLPDPKALSVLLEEKEVEGESMPSFIIGYPSPLSHFIHTLSALMRATILHTTDDDPAPHNRSAVAVGARHSL